MISSKNNETIKEYAKLQNKKYRDESNLFLAEGNNLVEEALKYGDVLEKFEVGIDVTQEVMDKLASYKGCKSIAVVKKPKKANYSDKMLLLDNIQDPGNLGTILRSAVSFGFDTVILDNCVDPYNTKVVRSSEGAIFKINLINEDLINFIKNNKEYDIFGTSLRNATKLSDIKFNKKTCIILGNEGNGVRNEILDLCKQNIFIEMKNMESLNVGIAAGILMYEASKY